MEIHSAACLVAVAVAEAKGWKILLANRVAEASRDDEVIEGVDAHCILGGPSIQDSSGRRSPMGRRIIPLSSQDIEVDIHKVGLGLSLELPEVLALVGELAKWLATTFLTLSMR